MTHEVLIGFTGKLGSGKDTAALTAIKNGFTRVAFADVLKRVAENINPYVRVYRGAPTQLSYFLEWCDWDWDSAKKNYSVRGFLQNLGVAIRREDPEFWVRAAGIEKALEEHGRVVVSDVRFPNEVQYIEDLGGTVVRIVRPGKNGDSHISETALDGYVLPELDNDGTLEDLEHRVTALIQSLGGLSA